MNPFKLVPQAPHGLTDEELWRWVSREFPNATGSLRLLIDRFEATLDREEPEDWDHAARCPECGTTFPI